MRGKVAPPFLAGLTRQRLAEVSDRTWAELHNRVAVRVEMGVVVVVVQVGG